MPLSRCLVIFEKELCTFSKKIAIAVTEVVLIQLFSLAVVSKQKIKMKTRWDLHVIQTSALLKIKESHFSLFWLMVFSIISQFSGYVKVFPIL